MRTKTFQTLLTALLLCVAALVPTAAAQITGDIQVRVLDPSGAVVPNAAITVRSKDTSLERKANTDEVGAARFNQLGVGTYTVKVEAAGFAPVQVEAVVNSGATITVPISLELRTQAQEVVVTDVASQVNTVNAQLQNSTDAQKVVALPLNGGVLALSATGPGVIPVTPRNPFLGLGSFNSNGGRGRGNNITLDNATATDVSTTGGAGLGTVPVDGIKEFTVITNNFNAEFGRNASAQVQILTKSGGNSFHGSLFEFFRNDKLNTRDYFDTTGKASVLRNNDWGATAGGPVIKDRLFWFATYEQQKIRGSGGTRVATVPTTANATDPTARQLLQQLQVPISPTGTIGNAAPLGTDTWAWSVRMDAHLTDRDIVYGRFGIQDSKAKSPGLTFISSNLPTNGASSVNRPVNATFSYTRTFSPRVVNTFLAAFGRSEPNFSPLFNFGGPEIAFTDGTSNFGVWAGLPQGRIQNTYQYLDNLTYTRGAHTIKIGGELNRVQANSYFDANVRGTITFLTLADFMAGRPFQYTQRFGNSVRGSRVWNHFYFVQDDWRLRRDLTVNLGLRTEVAHGVTEVNGILSNLNLNRRDALGGAGTGAWGAFDTGGSSFGNNTNWAPRVGFAWNPGNGKLVIRGGYGLAYDFIFLNPITNMRFLPPYMYQLALPQSGFTGTNTFANIIAGTSEFQQQGRALVGNFGTTIRNFGAISPVDQGLNNPQVQQWSLTVERELPWNLTGRVAYVGTKGNFLQRARPINLRAAPLILPATAAEEAARAAEFAAINSGLNPGPTTPSNRIDPRFNAVTYVEASANSNFHSLQTNLGRRFTNGYGFQASYTWGKSIDDISDVLGVLANDVANQQDPRNNRNNRAVSQFDVTHRFVLTHNFQPNWFRGVANPFLRQALHGWEFNGIFQAQTGFPVNIFSGTHAGLADPTLLGGNGAVRPNVTGPINIAFAPNPGSGSRNPNKVTGSGLTQPLVGYLGALGRNSLRLNPLIQADWAFGKSFQIREGYRIAFTAQFFNMFNNTTFSRPGATLSAPATFGYYADTDTDTRNVTLQLRFIW
jgi:hypothetical protein